MYVRVCTYADVYIGVSMCMLCVCMRRLSRRRRTGHFQRRCRGCYRSRRPRRWHAPGRDQRSGGGLAMSCLGREQTLRQPCTRRESAAHEPAQAARCLRDEICAGGGVRCHFDFREEQCPRQETRSTLRSRGASTACSRLTRWWQRQRASGSGLAPCSLTERSLLL